MTVYSGPHYTVLIAPKAGSRVAQRKNVTAREWDRAFQNRYYAFADYEIIGRGRNLTVELFNEESKLQQEYNALGLTVTRYNHVNRPSLYPDTSVRERNLTQRLTDTLYSALLEDEGTVPYAVIAGTDQSFFLICCLPKPLNASISTTTKSSPPSASGAPPEAKADSLLQALPETVTFNGAPYPVLGLVLHNEPHFLTSTSSTSAEAAEEILGKYLLLTEDGQAMEVQYRWLDLVKRDSNHTEPDETNKADEAAETKVEKKRIRRKQKRDKHKSAGSSTDGTETSMTTSTEDTTPTEEGGRVKFSLQEFSETEDEKDEEESVATRAEAEVPDVDEAVEDIRENLRRASMGSGIAKGEAGKKGAWGNGPPKFAP